MRAGQANQWTEAIRLRQDEASLVGAAELWFESQAVGPKHETWAEFQNALVTRCREDHFSERLEEELRSIWQHRGETVPAYAERFRYICGQGDELPALDALACYWVRGLRGQTSAHCGLMKPLVVE